MSTAEFAELPSGAEQVPVARFRHWTALRRCALGVYVVLLVAFTVAYGIPVQRELVIGWTCGALACASIGRPPREIVRLALDWLPIVAILWVYDLTRGIADSLGMGVNYTPMIHFDQFVFFGDTPTEWLQARLYDPTAVNWWEACFSIVYTSYFIVPFALAGYLWSRDRPAFLGFTRRLVTLATAGLATYVLFPAAPPWMAGEEGLIGEVHRSTARGWELLHIATTSWFERSQDVVNQVAAVPSLHSGVVALVAMFLWSRVRPAWRPLLLAYPLAMGLTLVATGEHYVFDVILGWLYAGAVMAGWGWWERRRLRGALAQP